MKTVLLIDGGHLRACAKAAKHQYNNAFIEQFATTCFSPEEYLFRIFYYDAPLFRGEVKLPVSNNSFKFQASDQWLHDLAKLERFAVRVGTLGFRGWRPRKIPISSAEIKDSDFEPVFEQKGVDMRIGLDIAGFCEHRSIDRILLVSADADMIPAMKHARKAGLEVGLVQLAPPAHALMNNMKSHCDFVRCVGWPQARSPSETESVASPPQPG